MATFPPTKRQTDRPTDRLTDRTPLSLLVVTCTGFFSRVRVGAQGHGEPVTTHQHPLTPLYIPSLSHSHSTDL